MPSDSGTHQRINSSGMVQALKTSWTGPLKVRVTTSSRSEVRSVVVSSFMSARLFARIASIGFLLLLEFFDDGVERVEPFGPALAMAFDPGCLVGQGSGTQPAGADTTDLPGGDEARLLEHAHMLFHAGERHSEAVGELRDRRVRLHQLFEHAAPGRVGQGGERSVEMRLILNLVVQYMHELAVGKGLQTV